MDVRGLRPRLLAAARLDPAAAGHLLAGGGVEMLDHLMTPACVARSTSIWLRPTGTVVDDIEAAAMAGAALDNYAAIGATHPMGMVQSWI